MTKPDVFYMGELARVSAEVKRLMFEEKAWEPCKTSKGVVVHRHFCGATESHVFRGEATMPVTPEKLFDMVHPTAEFRFKWDPNPLKCDVLRELSHNALVIKTVMKPLLMGLVSARDAVDVVLLETTAEYLSCQNGSVESDDVPVSAHCIRAWTHPMGIFIFRTSDPATSRVVSFFHANFSLHKVPISLIEAAIPTLVVQFFQALHKTKQLAWEGPLWDVPGRRAPPPADGE